MSTIYSHRYDNVNTEEQLKTLTLSLKSIEGNERILFSGISNYAENNNRRIASITASTKTLTNLCKNLRNAAWQLIQIEQNGYNLKGRGGDFVRYAQEYGFTL